MIKAKQQPKKKPKSTRNSERVRPEEGKSNGWHVGDFLFLLFCNGFVVSQVGEPLFDKQQKVLEQVVKQQTRGRHAPNRFAKLLGKSLQCRTQGKQETPCCVFRVCICSKIKRVHYSHMHANHFYAS